MQVKETMSHHLAAAVGLSPWHGDQQSPRWGKTTLANRVTGQRILHLWGHTALCLTSQCPATAVLPGDSAQSGHSFWTDHSTSEGVSACES